MSLLIYLLLDTNIYLDMRFNRHSAVPPGLEARFRSLLTENEHIRLIVPHCIRGEYERNVRRVHHASQLGLSAIIGAMDTWQFPMDMHDHKIVKDLPKISKAFHELRRHVRDNQEAYVDVIWFESWLKAEHSIPVPTSPNVILAALQREIDHRAPASNGGSRTDAIVADIVTNPRKYIPEFDVTEDEVWLVSRDEDFHKDGELDPELAAEAKRNGVQLKLMPFLMRALKDLGLHVSDDELRDERESVNKVAESQMTLADLRRAGADLATIARVGFGTLDTIRNDMSNFIAFINELNQRSTMESVGLILRGLGFGAPEGLGALALGADTVATNRSEVDSIDDLRESDFETDGPDSPGPGDSHPNSSNEISENDEGTKTDRGPM